MNFPEWAPKSLVGWANRAEESRNWEKESGREPTWRKIDHLIIQALTDPRMEKVWRSYKKRCYQAGWSSKNDTDIKEQCPWMSAASRNDQKWNAVPRIIMCGIDWDASSPSKWSVLTTEEKRQELERLIDAAHTIESVLRKNALNVMLPSLLNKHEVERMTELIPAHVEPDLFEELGEYWGMELATHVVPHVLFNCGTIYDILSNLSDKAQSALRGLDRKQIIERPNKKNVKATKFIRHACIWNVSEFGTPLYENVSILGNVLLDLSLTKENVIDSFRPIKGQPDVENTWAGIGMGGGIYYEKEN